MSDLENSPINPGVGSSIGSKQQIPNRSLCLLHDGFSSGVFAAGDHCLQCDVHTGSKFGEVYIPANPEASCAFLPVVIPPQEVLKKNNITVIFES